MSSLTCVFCQASDESTQHMFVECPLIQRVWSQCLKWIGILFVQHKDLKHHFESFHLSFMTTKQNQVWRGIWAVVIRCIWEQRNSIIFKQKIADAEEIFLVVQLRSWLWLKHRAGPFNYAFSDWHLNPIIYIKSCC